MGSVPNAKSPVEMKPAIVGRFISITFLLNSASRYKDFDYYVAADNRAVLLGLETKEQEKEVHPVISA
jgi:hypothetical protein